MSLGSGALGVEPLGGNQADAGTITLGRATSTNTARSVTVVTVITLGRATTTNTARLVSANQTLTLGRGVSSEGARRLDRALTLGRPSTTEIGRALSVISGDTVSIGDVVETDTARSVSVVQVKTLGRAAESDVARTLVHSTTVTLGRSTSTDIARALNVTGLVVFGTTQTINFGTDTGSPVTATDLVVIAMDKELKRAPTSLAVSVYGAEADEDLDFKIDGATVATDTADADGTVQEISIPVDESVVAGVHTVSVLSASAKTGSDTFTVLVDPIDEPVLQGVDTDPVLIPEALVNGVYKWVLQDLMPGGLGSWVMPINPASMTSPGVETPVTVQHTTAVVTGRSHIWQGGSTAVEWSFSGFCPDQDFYEQLQDYASLTRRFYIIDHRSRAWKVAITGLDMVARLRALDENGAPLDWRHDYTVRAVIYEQNALVPA